MKWNAEGAVFDKPTIFSTRQGLQGVGEAGKEAVAPIDVLQGYVRAAVQQENQLIGKILIEQFQALIDFLSRQMPHSVMLDSGALIGTLTPGIDAKLSDRWRRNER